MENHSVVCLATSRSQAESIVEDLRMSEFSNDDISVLIADHGATRESASRVKLNPSDRKITSKAGSSDRAPGWLPASQKLAIPSQGRFIATGPVLAALSHGSSDGIAGCLVDMGFPATEARRFQGKLHKGQILIAVHSGDPYEVSYAKRNPDPTAPLSLVSFENSPLLPHL